jgi:hypothetical protein
MIQLMLYALFTYFVILPALLLFFMAIGAMFKN